MMSVMHFMHFGMTYRTLNHIVIFLNVLKPIYDTLALVTVSFAPLSTNYERERTSQSALFQNGLSHIDHRTVCYLESFLGSQMICWEWVLSLILFLSLVLCLPQTRKKAKKRHHIDSSLFSKGSVIVLYSISTTEHVNRIAWNK